MINVYSCCRVCKTAGFDKNPTSSPDIHYTSQATKNHQKLARGRNPHYNCPISQLATPPSTIRPLIGPDCLYDQSRIPASKFTVFSHSKTPPSLLQPQNPPLPLHWQTPLFPLSHTIGVYNTTLTCFRCDFVLRTDRSSDHILLHPRSFNGRQPYGRVAVIRT